MTLFCWDVVDCDVIFFLMNVYLLILVIDHFFVFFKYFGYGKQVHL